jgi:hypothetical protein
MVKELKGIVLVRKNFGNPRMFDWGKESMDLRLVEVELLI